VHAPQLPRSQTSLAPVRSRWLRSARSRVTRGSTVNVRAAPFTFRDNGTASGPRTVAAAGVGVPVSRPEAAAPTPAVLRNVRRVTVVPSSSWEGGLGMAGPPSWGTIRFSARENAGVKGNECQSV
jgi:hypothetical protein